MKKKRTYNTRLIKRHRSHTVQEIAALYDLHPNAVHRWIKAGLRCIDNQKPLRVHGDDLIAFLKTKQTTRKRPCNVTEAYCCKCRKAQPFWENAVDLLIRNPKQLTITGLCAVCSTKTFKGGSIRKLSEYQKTFHVQTIQGQHLIARDDPPVKCEIERRR